ncbi:hypothetical protein GCM10027517_00770 [Phycicoccus ginsengisoli]
MRETVPHGALSCAAPAPRRGKGSARARLRLDYERRALRDRNLELIRRHRAELEGTAQTSFPH